MSTLVADLNAEIDRALELAHCYELAGGNLSAPIIRQEVEYARAAMRAGDVLAMRHWLKSLKGFQQ